jgi:hypothetical protein
MGLFSIFYKSINSILAVAGFLMTFPLLPKAHNLKTFVGTIGVGFEVGLEVG